MCALTFPYFWHSEHAQYFHPSLLEKYCIDHTVEAGWYMQTFPEGVEMVFSGQKFKNKQMEVINCFWGVRVTTI